MKQTVTTDQIPDLTDVESSRKHLLRNSFCHAHLALVDHFSSQDNHANTTFQV